MTPLELFTQQIDQYQDALIKLKEAIAHAENVYCYSQGLGIGAKVLYDGEEYYVFQHEPYPRYGIWLTLTKLRKDGMMPLKPIKTVYTYSTNVEVITEETDENE